MGRTFQAVVIDDDEWIKKLVAIIFKEQGFEVFTFPDAFEPLQKLDNGFSATIPDIVITDLHLPGIDGFAVIETLINRGVTIASMAIMSGHWTSNAGKRAEKLGIRIFPKPFQLDEIIHWISTIRSPEDPTS